jgi:hypothetical protein
MSVTGMQPVASLLVDRDADDGTAVLLVKFVAGASGPTVANEMHATQHLLVEYDPMTGRRVLLVKQVE